MLEVPQPARAADARRARAFGGPRPRARDAPGSARRPRSRAGLPRPRAARRARAGRAPAAGARRSARGPDRPARSARDRVRTRAPACPVAERARPSGGRAPRWRASCASASASCLDRPLQLGLVHLRAALDAELLGLVVELLAGAARAGRSSPSAGRRGGRRRCPASSCASAVRDSPERARSLLTVRAAISSARALGRAARLHGLLDGLVLALALGALLHAARRHQASPSASYSRR